MITYIIFMGQDLLWHQTLLLIFCRIEFSHLTTYTRKVGKETESISVLERRKSKF
jgi:hypothetical protein